jgi:CheY-like chemotaxis protein
MGSRSRFNQWAKATRTPSAPPAAHNAVATLDVDGLEVLRVVKSDPALRMIPVVVLTSSREEQDVVRSYELGVNAYVVKPVEFDKFLGAVRDLGLFWLLVNEAPPALS